MGEDMEYCRLCRSPANAKCSSCLSVAYCSKEHQRSDWKNHKPNCQNYEVKHDESLGRYMAAKWTIKKGEVVLNEKPLVIGPSNVTGPVCLGCHNSLKPESCFPCERCGWPVCSEECSRSINHKPECVWAIEKRKEKVRISQFVTPHPTYACITPLRLCYMSKNDNDLWSKVTTLESHCSQRKEDGKYEQDRFSVAKLLKRFYKLDDFTEDEIIKICGIIQINAHELPLSDPGHVAVYWRCSMLEHSCIPNCSKSFTDNGDIVIRAAVDIRPGEHLSISYTDPIWNTQSRRHHLLDSKYFSCECPRCIDPTEFDTNFSGITCQKIDCGGVVLPRSFADSEDWFCRTCMQPMTQKMVLTVLADVADWMAKVNRNSVQSHVEFVEKCKGVVPDNHCHLVEVKLTLAQMIGQTSSKGLASVGDVELRMKEELCRELLNLTAKICRAECRIRGVLHFELHAAIAEKARRDVKRNPKNNSTAQIYLLESGVHLEQVISFLKFEPKALPEGRIYDQALINLKDLNTFKNSKIAQ